MRKVLFLLITSVLLIIWGCKKNEDIMKKILTRLKITLHFMGSMLH